MKTQSCSGALMCAFFFAHSLSLFAQGSLTPPPGAPAPTMKTLDQVEPRIAINATNTPGDADSLFKITQPGSYYLTGNITGVVGKHGIALAASGVTLDLNGFDLVGVAGSLNGVSTAVASLKNIAVVNGSVRSWGGHGVDLVIFLASNCRAADLLASGNAGTGIQAGFGSTISNCSVFQNGGRGISAVSNSTVANCSAYQNSGTGIYGNLCTITGCTAYSNTGNGITIGSGTNVTNCLAYNNTASGISAETGGCTIADCTATLNTGDGIACANACVIRGNACSFNGNGGDGAGIHATFGDNRIESNNCTGADRGIDVGAAGNIIIKNTCAGDTTDWVVAANNVFGPIIDRRAPASAAVNGFTAASTLGSTDPNANFSY